MNFWLYSPGENNCKWDTCKQEGIMVLGWGELGSLINYKNDADILAGIQKHYGIGSHKNDIKTVTDFYNYLKIGDVVFVKKGRSELIGFGVVDSEYLFNPEIKDTYKHYKKVKWVSFKNVFIDEYKMPYKTLTKLYGESLFLICNKYKDELKKIKFNKNYYLLSWNPDEWGWENFEKIINSLKEGKKYIEEWRFANANAQPGDVVYVYKTKGKDGLQGIFAAGEIVSSPKIKTNNLTGEIKRYANISFTKIIDLKETNRILELSTLQKISSIQKWNAQSSGIIIDKCDINKLNDLWESLDGISSIYLNPIEVNMECDGDVEGKTFRIEVNRYERNRDARNKCIKHYGCCCAICGFDFEKKYGELGKDFIEVHHLIPLNKIKKEYKVNPINDLIPVCPNCHSMIHRSKNIDKLLNIQAIKNELFNKKA